MFKRFLTQDPRIEASSDPKNWSIKESEPLEQALPSSRENLSQCIDLWQGKSLLEKTRLNMFKSHRNICENRTPLVMQHMHYMHYMHLHQSLKSKGDYGWDTWIIVDQ